MVKSIKTLLEEKKEKLKELESRAKTDKIEQNLGQLNLLELLDEIKETEDMQKEIKAAGSKSKCELLKFTDGTFRRVFTHVKVH